MHRTFRVYHTGTNGEVGTEDSERGRKDMKSMESEESRDRCITKVGGVLEMCTIGSEILRIRRLRNGSIEVGCERSRVEFMVS